MTPNGFRVGHFGVRWPHQGDTTLDTFGVDFGPVALTISKLAHGPGGRFLLVSKPGASCWVGVGQPSGYDRRRLYILHVTYRDDGRGDEAHIVTSYAPGRAGKHWLSVMAGWVDLLASDAMEPDDPLLKSTSRISK